MVDQLAKLNVILPLLVLAGTLLLPLAFIFPDALTVLVIFLIYTNAISVAVRYYNLPLLVGGLFPALLILPVGSYLIFKREKLVINLPFMLMVLFFFIQALGALFATRLDIAVDKITTFLTEGVGLYLLVINTVRTPRILKWAAIAVAIAGLLMGGIVLYQAITRTYQNNYGGFAQLVATSPDNQSNTYMQTAQPQDQPRQSGPIGEVNRFGQIMAMIVPLALALMIGLHNWKLQLLFFASAILTVAGAVLTYSRGTLLTLAVLWLAMFFIRFVRLRYLPLSLAPLLIVPLVVPSFSSRLETLQRIDVASLWSDTPADSLTTADRSVRSRATEMISSWLMFADNPIIGVGPGNYAVHYQDYANEVGIEVRLQNRQPHILYGGIAAENGSLGLACFLAIVGFTIRDLIVARRGWQTTDSALAFIVAGLILAIIVYLFSGLFLHFAYIRYVWLVMGLAGAAGAIYRSAPPAQENAAE